MCIRCIPWLSVLFCEREVFMRGSTVTGDRACASVMQLAYGCGQERTCWCDRVLECRVFVVSFLILLYYSCIKRYFYYLFIS